MVFVPRAWYSFQGDGICSKAMKQRHRDKMGQLSQRIGSISTCLVAGSDVSLYGETAVIPTYQTIYLTVDLTIYLSI